MKNKILIALAALAFVFTIALNINLSIDKNNDKLSGLTLENIDAYAECDSEVTMNGPQIVTVV